ncbi:MAG: iron-sulfur cluster carrier protein ApbC [Alphaproteobacteria bacterium]|nr:iron-sulfur cluster carrier protein ApbC [Alphaproteobacteria bacterium]
MVDNAELLQAVMRFFPKESIESVNLFEKRVIVTLVDVEEDEQKKQNLTRELLGFEGVEKISVIYTGERTKNPYWAIRGVKKIVAVASGKGGVGKSTTATNIALALSKIGCKTALFDADIYGPSIPTMLGYEGSVPVSYDGKTFDPFFVMGVQSMSIGTLVGRDTPLIWRGPKACGALQQLLSDVNWHEVDVMVIDMPPGTGDIQITLSQKVKIDGAVIVSTPQDIALIDAVKGVNMFKAVDVPILGIVENMSYHICEKCGHKEYVFGENGAKNTAEKLGVDFLGEIPLNIKIRTQADAGMPIVKAEPESEFAKAYVDIAQKIKEKLNI